MHRNRGAAITIGGSTDDPIKEIVQDLALAYNLAFFTLGEPREALELLRESPYLGSDRAIILLYSETAGSSSIQQWITEFYELREDSARIIVYALSEEWSGQLALDCIKAGAYDYLIRGGYDYEQLRDRIRRAIEDKPVYPAYSTATTFLEEKGYAFVSTPYYLPAARDDYLSGILVALENLGIPVIRADDERLGLYEKLLGHIDGSTFVIVNMSQYGRSINANVYFELGYAIGREKPVIVVRRPSRRRIPSDLEGIEYVEYVNSADLALKLYFGLRPGFGISDQASPYAFGTPITDPSVLHGHQKFMRDLLRRLSKNWVFLKGKHRSGKSSILASLPHYAPESFMFINVHLQIYDGREERFWSGLYQKIHEEAIKLGIHVSDTKGSSDYDRIMEAMELLISEWRKRKGNNARIIFLFDEAEVISSFSTGTQSNLRGLLEEWHLTNQVKAVFAGASNSPIEEISKTRKGSPLNNIFNVITIPELDKKAMTEVIQEPVKGIISYTRGALDFIIEKADGYAYYAQVICNHAFIEVLKKKKDRVTKRDIVLAYEQSLLSRDFGEFSSYWNSFTEELKEFVRNSVNLPNCKMTEHMRQIAKKYELVSDSDRLDIPMAFKDWIRKNGK